MRELRVYLRLGELQRQFASYVNSVVGGRGYVPVQGLHSLIIEIAPGLLIERVTDLAMKASEHVEPGILVVERQFGILELHSESEGELDRAGAAILEWLGVSADAQLKPNLLFSDVIESVTDRHAIIVNRSKQASMLLPGQSLLLVEVVPALYASYVANEVEKSHPDVTLVDVRMIGASGRVYVAGDADVLRAALTQVSSALEGLPGRTAA